MAVYSADSKPAGAYGYAPRSASRAFENHLSYWCGRNGHFIRRHFVCYLQMARPLVGLIRDRRSCGATFDHQPNFSANWISLPGVVVAFSTPAVLFGAPVPSKMSVRSSA